MAAAGANAGQLGRCRRTAPRAAMDMANHASDLFSRRPATGRGGISALTDRSTTILNRAGHHRQPASAKNTARTPSKMLSQSGRQQWRRELGWPSPVPPPPSIRSELLGRVEHGRRSPAPAGGGGHRAAAGAAPAADGHLRRGRGRHALVKELDRLAGRHGYQVTYSVGWELAAREKTAIGQVPEHAWEAAVDGRGEVRERRADDACAGRHCAHRTCWIEEAHVAELTGLLREGPAGDQLKGWPKTMRVFARRERPHPGARLSLFEAAGGWRYSLWVTNLPAATKGWRGQCAYIDAAHRVHARVEDVIRTGKNTGLGRFPSHDYGLNQAWLDASMVACVLLAWLKLLALDGDLARAEPKTLRYRILHAAARLVRGGRRRTLKIAATWPWAQEIVTAWQRVQAIPHPT